MTHDESGQGLSVYSDEDRCALRAKLDISARLRPAGSKRFDTIIYDLSISGFCARSVVRLHLGAVVWLTMEGLESLQAEVRWSEANRIGCSFRNLLSPIVFDAIRARYPQVPPPSPA